ncbi:MAG: hypothetical protein HZC48_06185 [Nitrospirae bacterium]|nr:hypothetical protein [Nitrospirota bacterium]
MKKTILFLFVLSVCFASISTAEEVRQGRITGNMMIKGGGPMSDGAVFIYDAKGPLPLPDKYIRVPDHIAEIDDDGKFSVEIAPGTYYFGGIKKISGKGPGPPKEGDYFFIIQEAAGMPRAYVVNENETLDIGTVSEAVLYKGITDSEGVTSIEGVILNGKGAPTEGMVVFANLRLANEGEVSFVSNWTGKDGKYFLRVHKGGTYTLNAVDSLGIYVPESTERVAVKTGEILRGINMKVVKQGIE